MSSLDQIVFGVPRGAGGTILPTATSLRDCAETERWLTRLDPWLRTGVRAGRAYLTSGVQAALVRWKGDTTLSNAWRFSHVLVGQAATLSPSYVLQLPDLPAEQVWLFSNDRIPRIEDVGLSLRPVPNAIENRARSASAIELLVPLLSRILAGEQDVTKPGTVPPLPDAVMWGLVSILLMLGDSRPFSFHTYAPGVPAIPAGRFVSFRPAVAVPSTDPRFEQAAIGLATSYADGPVQLRRMLLQHGILEPADQADRIARLLDLWPGSPPPTGNDQTRNAHVRGTHTMNADFGGQMPATAAPMPRPGQGSEVICPICLHQIDDWEGLSHWRWDSVQESYVELKIPPDASRQYRARLQRGSMVRCPDPQHVMQDEHYLPADYGRFGPPVVLGFIGVTKSGKSHLLTAMVGEMERGGLREYGIGSRPIDHALHKRFLDGWVRPLMTEGKVLPGTQEGVVTFADAFLISPASGPDRPVALFDVAGGELTQVDDTKQFLDIADGLIFVVDPVQLDADGLGDLTFNTVLDLVKSTEIQPGQLSAAIVLNKADLLRFEDPVAFWLRSDEKALDAAEFIRESADVYAFLYDKGAGAWTRPYRECARATLHVASATGGSGRESDGAVYPRGVTPRRVLRPLVAMLAMTGVLTGAEAGRVGI